ncbi:hypothetical protein GUITHDRAFT_118470 [Guillardia theta CCMP2712]|uniref:RWP-RK domain-containing protein n=1 Tax=Guillardia theta (strain CCMP2712) TaxID=905079 RepID=L1IGG8_GUITC|nr:hypothetical protein GUITHDRAFT_118470 [Guillardia theta CCMP2712]EKX35346.1 hypothetical protein GUITHDRAFT_118470 [Guillardia theta CCMP2712]|eukprot:XP_005822326.1 hypothetical protein GUITHDRAFT_118470 [Guillardia theta CCMP2712]
MRMDFFVPVRPAVLRGAALPSFHDWKLVDTSASTTQGIASLPKKVRLLPRRKRRSSVESPKEVVLGMDQISSLFHLPQCEAAQQMGISLSALKNVCRKVGLDKWPYKRKYSSTKGAQNCLKQADMSLFDEALEHVQGKLENSFDF